ncbi:LacI family DNA-binding transcriptional regulator [Angustibacter luteus]
MRDVAALAGVSAKTVSRVFNDDPHVRPETKERVDSALRELSYVPNTLATTFRSGRAPVIGVAVPDIADPFFGAIAKAIETLAAQHDMSVVITSLGDDGTREPRIVQSLLRQALSGLIIAPLSHDQSYLGSWTDRTPLVFVDRQPTGVLADSFTEDDHAGAHQATTHLVGHGHVRIGFVGDDASIPTTSGRLAGYRAALDEAGIEADDDLVALGAFDRASAAAACTALAGLADGPTALFSSNARATMSLVPLIRTGGLTVAGFGDFPMADMLTPAITVVDQDPAALGTLAAQRVLDRLAHPQRRYRRRTVLPVRLVERESCRSRAPRG